MCALDGCTRPKAVDRMASFSRVPIRPADAIRSLFLRRPPATEIQVKYCRFEKTCVVGEVVDAMSSRSL